MNERLFKSILLISVILWVYILVLFARGATSSPQDPKSVKSVVAKMMRK